MSVRCSLSQISAFHSFFLPFPVGQSGDVHLFCVGLLVLPLRRRMGVVCRYRLLHDIVLAHRLLCPESLPEGSTIRTNSNHCKHWSQWASYQILKTAGCACAGNAGNDFPPPPTSKETDCWLAIPSCITARASRTCRDACRERLPAGAGKTIPAFPAHAHPQFYVSGKRPMTESPNSRRWQYHRQWRQRKLSRQLSGSCHDYFPWHQRGHIWHHFFVFFNSISYTLLIDPSESDHF